MLLNRENALLQAPHANPKTPGLQKMSSKIPLNDENTTSMIYPKTGRKNLFAGRDPSQFVTPVGPRRPALTGKTTNVKARIIPSGAQGGKAGKPELRETIKPQQTQVLAASTLRKEEDDVPEIEYMPPVPPEIPYVPDGFDDEPDYKWLKKNYMKGCYRAYLGGYDENGKSSLDRQMEENTQRLEAELDVETELAICNTKAIRPPEELLKKLPAPAGSAKLSVSKTRNTDRAARSTSTSRKPSNSSIRPTSRQSSTRPSSRQSSSSHVRSSSRPGSSASLHRPTLSSSQRQVAGTLDSRRAAEALATRPTATSQSRSASTVQPTKRPLSFAGNRQPAPVSRSHSRSRSTVSNTATRSTIGYTTGREMKDSVKKGVIKARMESTLDAIERISKQDEEEEKKSLPLPPLILGDEDDDVVVDYPSPLMDEEEEFFMIMPEVAEE